MAPNLYIVAGPNGAGKTRGGHNVPEHVVRRRFKRGIVNFFQLYRPLLDFWVIFDNSTDNPAAIAYEEVGELQIIDHALFSKLSANLARQRKKKIR